MITPQDYPRVHDENSQYDGCLDEAALTPHLRKITSSEMIGYILSAIDYASRKSGREIINIPSTATAEEIDRIYKKEGKKLLAYFKKYCGDPASTAHQVYGLGYKEVGREQFRNRTLQKERMNSGWRYQFLVIECAQNTGRFRSVSDIGSAEADFNAVIDYVDRARPPIGLYVSVKNRQNTMGGQDWPKAIRALENVARNDRNRVGPYCCIFGIAMDKGTRYIKRNKTGEAHSINTEIWLSDFFGLFLQTILIMKL